MVVIYQNNNKGVTLIELVVSLAILALLATGVIGVMNSNTVVFRKNKTDIAVQNSAQETYNKIYEEIMQAKYVYIEGYLLDSDITFSSTKVGNDVSVSYIPVKLLRSSDINLINLASTYPSCEAYVAELVGDTITDRELAATNLTASYSDDQLKQFNTFYNSIRYMDTYEALRYARFVDYIRLTYGSSDLTAFDDSSIKSGSISSGFDFKNIVISKIVFQYSVPLNEKFVTDTSKIDYYEYTTESVDALGNPVITTHNEKADDYCVTTYEFVGPESVSENAKMKVNYEYYAMDKLNSSSYADNDVFAKTLNYVKAESSGSTTVLPGVVCQIDGEKDSIKLDLYFADKSMTYTDRGMIVLRNSYVLHDAN
ncbi:prepilin-type N-terminal cleavage/methylation domain-containing protein [Lachnospiraceae bacterium]|nr:prepilin-type N-terminal cleavage/methylation domain-containing protein [Lachnospiraceae bacterium]